ncbi:hypothetical protein DVH24_035515 [Malus domestica]|uniref:AMP-dependent synthetase/ligase domain-containing protein n=1 Tax=Malus domestica TaxID=3750 RepID=A0A498JBL5_MALDO|nr:hypothetical protein DVH24_035515 [Malus domestica]
MISDRTMVLENRKRMKIFSVAVEEGREGKDGKPSLGPVYRNLLAQNDFPPLDRQINSSWDLFSLSVQKYPGNRMLGWRKMVDGKPGPYTWKTYKEVYDEVLDVGSALRLSGVEPACNAHSLICVPLYDTLGPGAVNFIIDHAELDVVFVQDKKVKELLKPDSTSSKRIKVMVCFSSMTDEEKNKSVQIGIKPYSWNEFTEMGKQNPSEIVPPTTDNIAGIMYTSGTSGDPKGVVITHENVAYGVRGIDLFMEQFEDKMTGDDVYLSFLPLAHILDRVIEEYFFRNGAAVGYYHGDLNALRDDMVELKPTLLAGVKARLGGQLRLIISGGAPLSSEIEEFLRVTCCAFVVTGYGLTETIGPTTLGFPDEMCMVGAVGTVSVYNEMRLEEVPEMGYNPLGDHPCGEICVRGKTVFAGYYKNPELTREAIKDGWFHTGDIGDILPNGVIKVIDRKKNLIKLSQGEYVALEYLENVYGVASIIEDIWVYGNSFKSMIVAVVVPEEETAKKWAYLNGHMGSFSDLCSLDQLKDHIMAELKLIAERNKLSGFQYIKGIIIEPRPFDMERDLVTATLKKKRNHLLKYYQVYMLHICSLFRTCEITVNC